MSLRLRLNLLIGSLLLIFMLAVGGVIFQGSKESIQEGVEAATRVTTQLLDTVIISSTLNPDLGYTHDVLASFLNHLGHVRSNEIFLYDLNGKIIYRSPPSKYRADQKPPEWYIKLLTPKEESVTRLVRYGKLIIQPNPLGAIRESWAKMRYLAIIGLGFFITLNLAVYWMLGRWLRPLHPMIEAINQMERGDLSARLPTFDLPEFEKIGHSLNRMAESLAIERQLEENRQVTHLIQKHIEDERRSLARELHDELGQYVTAIKTFAVAIANKTKEKAPEVEASAQTIVAAANHIYDGMHNIIRQLRPGSLDNLGLVETLKDLINNVQKQQPTLNIDLKISGHLNELGETLNINIYRIVQESINNAVKHAEATQLNVQLTVSEAGELLLNISDNGKGMDVLAVDQTNHFGLLGMRERIQGLHGTFHVESAFNLGTTIEIHIPQAIKIGQSK